MIISKRKKIAKANRNPTQGLKYFVKLKIFFGMLLCLTESPKVIKSNEEIGVKLLKC